MTNPAVIIVTGVVIAVAAVIAAFASSAAKPQTTSYGRRGYGKRNTRPSPPPSSFTRKREKRRKSPERCSYNPGQELTRESTENHSKSCRYCSNYPTVKVQPCNHEAFCKNCADEYLTSNVTCHVCKGRINSCSPPIPPFGKCKKCERFTKLFKFVPCDHSLSLCISCFEQQGKSYKVCPECNEVIRNSEPRSKRAGLCIVCNQFTQYSIFLPCGHGSFCRKHAESYLRSSEEECNECLGKVIQII